MGVDPLNQIEWELEDMARSPRGNVPKTSGAGVSRLSYQKGYALGNRGGGSPDVDVPEVKGSAQTDLKGGGGRKAPIDKAGGMNIAYEDILPVEDIEDVQNYAKGKPERSAFMKAAGAKLRKKLK